MFADGAEFAGNRIHSFLRGKQTMRMVLERKSHTDNESQYVNTILRSNQRAYNLNFIIRREADRRPDPPHFRPWRERAGGSLAKKGFEKKRETVRERKRRNKFAGSSTRPINPCESSPGRSRRAAVGSGGSGHRYEVDRAFQGSVVSGSTRCHWWSPGRGSRSRAWSGGSWRAVARRRSHNRRTVGGREKPARLLP